MLEKLALTEDTYPTKFQNHLPYLSIPLPRQRLSPPKRRETVIQWEEEIFLKWCEVDKIATLDAFKSTVKEKIKGIWSYKV